MCHDTSTEISLKYTYVPFLWNPPFSSHPWSLTQSTGFELPASHSKFPLAIKCSHSNVYVTVLISGCSMLFFTLIHESVFYVYISIAALRIGSTVPSFLIPYICINIQYLFFPVWLTLLFIIGSRFIRLVKTLKCNPNYDWVICYVVYIYHSCFIHSSVDRHLDCFHIQAIVNNAEVNIKVHVSFSTMFSSGYIQ